MFCTKCGYKLSDDDLFCGNCGAKVKAEATQEQAASPVVETSSTQDVKPADGEKTADGEKMKVSPKNQVVRQLPGKGLRKDLKLPPKRKVVLPKPQRCSSSGAEGGLMAQARRPVSTADVARAEGIGEWVAKRPAIIAPAMNYCESAA